MVPELTEMLMVVLGGAASLSSLESLESEVIWIIGDSFT
jgi:hypothetical protein